MSKTHLLYSRETNTRIRLEEMTLPLQHCHHHQLTHNCLVKQVAWAYLKPIYASPYFLQRRPSFSPLPSSFSSDMFFVPARPIMIPLKIFMVQICSIYNIFILVLWLGFVVFTILSYCCEKKYNYNFNYNMIVKIIIGKSFILLDLNM
ncbi:hypothetical protein Lalb_Chr17g0346651 [Lupinus albus]|uniref:Uncharacterized protein n=1 Tax=Lupinus albus TaxID=3870 RepID=A0A6A4P6W1_LUPAL|nr:hypothetical protein Lalb_Chr17g0346651 [Lupinus albus]